MPSPEWVAREFLSMGLRQVFIRTVARARPLAKFRVPDLGAHVYAELVLMPSLEVVLRVRDHETDEVLAQSQPDNFQVLDMNATQAVQLLRDWRDARAGATPAGPEA